MNKLKLATIIVFGLIAQPAVAQEVQSCEVVFLEDSSAGGQRRWRAFVFSDAATVADRLATATYAAREILDRTNYHYVDVFLTPNAAPRDRSELSSLTSVAWIKYAANPEVIPWMDTEVEASATDQVFVDVMNFMSLQDATDVAATLLEIDDPDRSCDLTLP